jgi:hypothetical protein
LRRTADLVEGGDPERLGAAAVTFGFFEVLGVTPLLGRSIARDEDVSASGAGRNGGVRRPTGKRPSRHAQGYRLGFIARTTGGKDTKDFADSLCGGRPAAGGLMARSFLRVQEMQSGFRSDSVLAFDMKMNESLGSRSWGSKAAAMAE